MEPLIFETEDRARFEDFDPQGIVNNTRYLTYFMDHRAKALRENLGWDLKTMSQLPFLFVLKKIEINYMRPIRTDAEFSIKSHVTEIMNEDAKILCALDIGGKVHSTCNMIVTCVDIKTMRPIPWPEDTVKQFYK